MKEYTAAIIGGGASGISAAISAKRSGTDCVILEKMPSLGRKILASGNGRCNLLNEKLDESCYSFPSNGLIAAIFKKFGKEEILGFFLSLGLRLKSESGRMFPATNQAATVLRLLELEIDRLCIPVEPVFNVVSVARNKGGFIVTSKLGTKIACRYLVLAGGGRSYPALGSDGSAYSLAVELGHTIVEPVPAAVPLVCRDPVIHKLQGQRISAAAKSIINGKEYEAAEGELLFTKYGLSGTAILDISQSISIALNRDRSCSAEVSVDSVPSMSLADLRKELLIRAERKFPKDDFLVGILPNKLSRALKNFTAAGLKDWRFKITGTRSWNEAEFTAGGIDTREVDEKTLGSKLVNGLYFAGEVLDVNGKRGGYNLAWAWASGNVAGQLG